MNVGTAPAAAAPADASRRRRWLLPLIVASVGLHVAGGAALFLIKAEKKTEVIAIEMSDAKKPKKKDTPPPPPPKPPPVTREPEAPRQRPAARAPESPKADTNTAPAAPPAFDLGMSNLTGGGGGGVSIPEAPSGPTATTSSSARAPETREVTKTLGGTGAPGEECTEPLVKPTPKSVPQPAYPEAARADGITGKVRVEVTIDASGSVAGARVLSGLGHGLDEAALGAARSAKFSPATKCGRPTTATFVIGMRFAL